MLPFYSNLFAFACSCIDDRNVVFKIQSCNFLIYTFVKAQRKAATHSVEHVREEIRANAPKVFTDPHAEDRASAKILESAKTELREAEPATVRVLVTSDNTVISTQTPSSFAEHWDLSFSSFFSVWESDIACGRLRKISS